MDKISHKTDIPGSRQTSEVLASYKGFKIIKYTYTSRAVGKVLKYTASNPKIYQNDFSAPTLGELKRRINTMVDATVKIKSRARK